MRNLLLLITLLYCTGSFASEVAKAVYQKFSPQVVLIESRHGTGTGFFINPQTLVTNRHVVFGLNKNSTSWNAPRTFQLRNGTKVSRYQMLICSKTTDICLICFKEKFNVATLELSTRDVVPGKDLFVLGHPQGIRQQIFSSGIVSSRHLKLPGTGISGSRTYSSGFSTTAAISQGSSGSPVISAEGSVLGIVVSSVRDSQNLNFVISSDEILKLYNEGLNFGSGIVALPFGFEHRLESRSLSPRGSSSSSLQIDLNALESKRLRSRNPQIYLGPGIGLRYKFD
ncbi:MAG TPA: serine protease [Bacteriovoracaceae bacterium]|nr:serine protease [Bacteriovoracaceae bacterium]